MASISQIREIVDPVVTGLGLRVFDVEQHGQRLVITVDREGGVDLEQLTSVNRAVGRALDEADPIAGRYTLEVSSPGLERPLRIPEHFAWAVGQKITVRTQPGHEGERRYVGVLAAADGTGICLDVEEPAGATVEIPYDEIQRARTVFEWESEPKHHEPHEPHEEKVKNR